MNIKIKTILFLTVFLSATITVKSQVYELSASGNKVEITGTSSLHDWEMEVAKYTSGFRIVREGTALKKIENVVFSSKASDIKSDNSIMNKKTQEALRANEFPEIKFAATTVSDLTQEGNSIKGTVKGKLTLAGQTHDISVPFNGTINEGKIEIKASSDLTFSGFGMEPPTAMLGTLKTGDKVKVTFNLIYNQK
ncbi:MAG TPA: YceI family protein [Bacteroidales bacterium]|nr:YceI family protein [Bacteroidales bacterium]